MCKYGSRVATTGLSTARVDKERGETDSLEESATVFQVEVFSILQIATRQEVKNSHKQEIYSSGQVDLKTQNELSANQVTK